MKKTKLSRTKIKRNYRRKLDKMGLSYGVPLCKLNLAEGVFRSERAPRVLYLAANLGYKPHAPADDFAIWEKLQE